MKNLLITLSAMVLAFPVLANAKNVTAKPAKKVVVNQKLKAKNLRMEICEHILTDYYDYGDYYDDDGAMKYACDSATITLESKAVSKWPEGVEVPQSFAGKTELTTMLNVSVDGLEGAEYCNVSLVRSLPAAQFVVDEKGTISYQETKGNVWSAQNTECK